MLGVPSSPWTRPEPTTEPCGLSTSTTPTAKSMSGPMMSLTESLSKRWGYIAAIQPTGFAGLALHRCLACPNTTYSTMGCPAHNYKAKFWWQSLRVIKAILHKQVVLFLGDTICLLVQAGATAVVPETLEPSLQLASAVLTQLNIGSDEVAQAITDFRKTHVSELRVSLLLWHDLLYLHSVAVNEHTSGSDWWYACRSLRAQFKIKLAFS